MNTKLSALEVKDRYNTTIGEVYDHAYEEARWSKTPLMRAERSMMEAMFQKLVFTQKPPIKRYLEAGPGPGTWTRRFIQEYPNSSFDLVDISAAMLAMARKALPQDKKIRFIESDFCEHVSDELYDFFLSSRALEYFPDQPAFVSTLNRLLAPGAQGIIFTKMPQYARRRLLGKRASAFHSGQLSPHRLRSYLRDAGFEAIRLYPAIVLVPLFRNPVLNRMLFSVLSPMPLNPISAFFSESYVVTFRKPI